MSDPRAPGATGRSVHTGPAHARVDVIVPVYDALEDVKRCLEALFAHRELVSEIVVVNDRSGPETTELLRGFAERDGGISLIENEQNVGYTRAANVGLRRSRAPYVLLLNSDTIVSEGWLARLLGCADSDERIGIVGPLSNAATWQSVPEVKDASGKFAVNALPAGFTVAGMAAVVAGCSSRAYPRAPFLNGFCLLIKRAVLDAVGLFDEIAFPWGYGEENDLCVRARDAGFELAIADDAFVYHAKSKSYGSSRRDQLAKAGYAALKSKHGAEKIETMARQMAELDALQAVRSAVARALLDAGAGRDPLSLRVLFLLPVAGGGGGAHSVVQESSEMVRLGLHVRVAVRGLHLQAYREAYRGELACVDELFVGYEPSQGAAVGQGYDVVVATAYPSVDLLERIVDAYPEVLPAYYVQDYEPLFFDSGSAAWQAARESYTRLPSALLFAKTMWIAEQVRREHGLSVQKVAPSLDHSVYFPGPAPQRDKVVIVAMVRPRTRRRGAERTVRVLTEVARRFPNVVLDTFGCAADDPALTAFPRDLAVTHHGRLNRSEVARLLRASDIFVDLSDYQAFGRTGLEAMACGCAVILPRAGGVTEYAEEGKNAVVVDTSDEAACVVALSALVAADDQRRRLREAGLLTASRFSVREAALSEVAVFVKALSARAGQRPVLRPRVHLLPPVRKGALTAAGWTRLLGIWTSSAVRRSWSVVTSSEGLPPPRAVPQIAIFHHDSLTGEPEMLTRWAAEFRRLGGRIVLDAHDHHVFDPMSERLERGKQPARDESRARQLLQCVDAVLVGSEEARASLLALNDNVFVVPNGMGGELWDAWADAAAPLDEVAQVIRVGYLGSSSRPGDLAIVEDVLTRLATECGEGLRIEIIGAHESSGSALPNRVGLPRNCEYPRFLDWMRRRANWDIAILPCTTQGDPPCDLDLRYLMYTSLGAATVGSDHPALRGVAKHGHSALLVPNDAHGWYDALRRLIASAELRRELLAGARATRAARQAQHDQTLLQTLQAISSLPAAHRPWPVGPRQRSVSLAVAEGGTRRKLAKLRRDPRRFFGDSKSALMRGLGSLLWGERGRS
jgi:GT2 family glycosyltransferase/glycosyltransferase involved in cell wall biosynthesis